MSLLWHHISDGFCIGGVVIYEGNLLWNGNFIWHGFTFGLVIAKWGEPDASRWWLKIRIATIFWISNWWKDNGMSNLVIGFLDTSCFSRKIIVYPFSRSNKLGCLGLYSFVLSRLVPTSKKVGEVGPMWNFFGSAYGGSSLCLAAGRLCLEAESFTLWCSCKNVNYR